MMKTTNYNTFNSFYAAIAALDYDEQVVGAMCRIYEQLSSIVMENDEDATITCSMNHDLNLAAIEAVTFGLSVRDSDMPSFLDCLSGASNVCVYSQIDDMISVSCLFRNVLLEPAKPRLLRANYRLLQAMTDVIESAPTLCNIETVGNVRAAFRTLHEISYSRNPLDEPVEIAVRCRRNMVTLELITKHLLVVKSMTANLRACIPENGGMEIMVCDDGRAVIRLTFFDLFTA